MIPFGMTTTAQRSRGRTAGKRLGYVLPTLRAFLPSLRLLWAVSGFRDRV